MSASYPAKGSLAGKNVADMRLLSQSKCHSLSKMPDDAFHKEVRPSLLLTPSFLIPP